jgi:hypothetical protein
MVAIDGRFIDTSKPSVKDGVYSVDRIVNCTACHSTVVRRVHFQDVRPCSSRQLLGHNHLLLRGLAQKLT